MPYLLADKSLIEQGELINKIQGADMYTLKTEHSFDAAHFLYGYEGKCSNIHGHRWRVVAEVSSDELETTGQNRGMYV